MFSSILHLITIGIFVYWSVINYGTEKDYYMLNYIQSLSTSALNNVNPNNVGLTRNVINKGEMMLFNDYFINNIKNIDTNKLISMKYKIYNVKEELCLNNFCPSYTNLNKEINPNISVSDISFYGINTVYDATPSKIIDITQNDTIQIQKNTRALMLDVIQFNPELQTTIITRVLHEILATGGIITSIYTDTIYNIYEMKSYIFIVEMVFIGLVVLSFLLNLIKKQFSKSNFVILLFISAIVPLRYFWNLNIHSENYFYLSLLNTSVRICAGTLAILLWMRLFLVVDYVKKFQWFINIFYNVLSDMISFLVVFIITIISMGHFAFMVFPGNYDFRSIQISVISMFKNIFGGLNIDDLSQTNRIFGPIFFVFFYVLVVIVMINVFIAIIVDSYMNVRKDEAKTKEIEMKEQQQKVTPKPKFFHRKE